MLKEYEEGSGNVILEVTDGNRIVFWKDKWCRNCTLNATLSAIYNISC